MRKSLLSLLVVVILVGFVSTLAVKVSNSEAGSKAKYTMRFQTAWPTAFGLNGYAKHLARQIEMESKGQIAVDFYTAGQIVPGMEVWDAASTGVIDAAHVCTCYTVGKSWTSGFFCNGPAMPPPALKALWMYEGGGLKVAERILSKYYAVKLFPAYVITEIWAYSNSEINNLNDLRKLKFRASGVRASTLKNLGCSVLSLPGGELIPAMEKGVIDAFEYSSLFCDQTFGADEVAKYIYYSHIIDGGTPFLVINKGWWNKLPQNLKKAIETAAYNTTSWSFGQQSMKELKAMYDSETKRKTQIRWLPSEVEKAIIKSAKEIIAKRREKDPEMQWYMDSLDAFMAKYGKFAEFRSNMY